MITASAGLVLVTLAALPLARMIDPGADRSRLTGQAILLGHGLAAAVLFAFSLAGLRWSLLATATTIVILGALFWTMKRFKRAPLPSAVIRRDRRSWLFDALTVITASGYALYATLAPPIHADFINNWGLKARAFWHNGGLDLFLLQNPWYKWAHPDYPLLVPLSLDYVTIFKGQYDDRLAALICTVLAAGFLLIARSLMREELGSDLYASAATLVMAPLVLAPLVGGADTPLAIFGIAGILLIRRAHRLAQPHAIVAGAVFLGLAASTKNEGVALIAATALAMLLAGGVSRRNLYRLWPAAVIAAPWLLLRNFYGLQTDIIEGSALSRILENLGDPVSFYSLLARYGGGQPLFWAGISVALLLRVRTVAKTERLAIAVVALQLGAYLVAYLATPYDLEWHIRWSWDRLISHVTPLLAFVSLVLLFPLLNQRADTGAETATSAAGISDRDLAQV